jgi:hypothetical protein
MRQWTLVIVTAILVGGCGSPKTNDRAAPSPSGSPTASESPSPSAPGSPTPKESQKVEFSTVTVSRTGGIAGFNDVYVVTPDGTLTVETRTSPKATKRLTPAELAQLRALVTSPAFRAEAAGDVGAKNCADGFVYTVKTGSMRAGGMDCGQLAEKAPTLWKVITLVQAASRRP